MVFITVVAGLFFLSFIMALLSLRKELLRPKEIKTAKREFQKEKILFKKN